MNDDPVDAGASETRDETFGRFGYDLNEAARRGDLEPVRCRDDEIARCVDILLRQTKHNPALVGAAGVGKTAIVEGLAQRIVAGDVPAALRGARIVSLDHVALLAGTIYRGQFEARVRRLVRAIEDDPEVILFVDEMHNLIGQGSAVGVAMDAANMLKPALVRPDIRVIGATTQVEYDRWVKGDPALERRFQPVVIRELTSSGDSRDPPCAPEPPRAPPRRRHRRRGRGRGAGPDRPLRHRPRAARQGHRRPRRGVRPRAGHRPTPRRAGAHPARAAATRCGAAKRQTGRTEAQDAQRHRGRRIPSSRSPAKCCRSSDRIGEEIEKFFAGVNGSADAKTPRRQENQTDERTDVPSAASIETLAERRDRLDGELRRGLEKLGIVVSGQDVARAVSVAVGKRIEWAG